MHGIRGIYLRSLLLALGCAALLLIQSIAADSGNAPAANIGGTSARSPH